MFQLSSFSCKAWPVKAWTQPNCGEQADGTRLEPRHWTKNHEELFQLAILAFVRVGRCAVRRCVWNSKKMQPLPVVVWEGYDIMGQVESFCANCSKEFLLCCLFSGFWYLFNISVSPKHDIMVQEATQKVSLTQDVLVNSTTIGYSST